MPETFSLNRILDSLIQRPSDNQLAISLVERLTDKNGIFIEQEDTQFDYKLEYPPSQSGDYFCAIVRLIMSFYNSFGGIIVVGVHDEYRTGGHNGNTIDIERLNTRLRELCGQSVNVHHMPLDEKQPKVDLLIVPRRPPSEPPARLQSQLGKYTAGTIWVRRGHECLEATSREIPFLFSPRIETNSGIRLPSYLPPSPSSLDRFVGRVDILSELWTWASQKDEPRVFLWGRGGSGKSTIAHEFASLVRNHGATLTLSTGDLFERVIFLSAKQRELNTQSGEIEKTKTVDFVNYRGLLEALLIATEYSTEGDFSVLQVVDLERCLKDVFDHESILIVLDDIDTLINSKEEAGFDALFKMSLRARKTIRIVYTQRSEPSFSENAVQVPGFIKEEDYLEFVGSCCEQFSVPLPNSSYLNGDLFKVSEAIPLIVETIIRLRRVTGSYEKAHGVFMERRGEEARRYLFEREYEALPRDDNARHILAAIAEFGSPVGNGELEAIVRIGESAVAEAIGHVIGFFLSTTISDSGETRYFLNPVTKTFIKRKTHELNFGKAIIERVKGFKSSGRRKPSDLVILEGQVERHLARHELEDAARLVSQSLPESISENPSFRMMRARVLAGLPIQRRAEARDDFQYCVDHGYEDADGMRAWFNMEKDHSGNQERISNLVIDGKSYAPRVRNEFKSRKAAALFYRAREMSDIDAFPILAESLALHSEAYCYFWREGLDVTLNHKFTRSTGFALVDCGRRLDLDKELLSVFRRIFRENSIIPEPLLDPMRSAAAFLSKGRGGDIGKRREGMLRNLAADFEGGRLKFDRVETTSSFISVLKEAVR